MQRSARGLLGGESNETAELLDFLLPEPDAFAWPHSSHFERTDAGSLELLYRMPHELAHEPHLALTTFVNDDLQHAGCSPRILVGDVHLRWSGLPALDEDSLAQSL